MLRCDICGGEGILLHKGVRDNPNIDVYECTDCKTKFLSDINDRDYEAGFMYETNNMSDMSIEERLRQFYPDDYRRYAMFSDMCKNKSVLDFGCGFGGFLQIMKDADEQNTNSGAIRVGGVELGSVERKYLLRKNIECKASIEEYNEKFDVITLFHTFEHLNNPKEWLVKFHNKLNSNGKLIIEVPNSNDVLLSLYECKDFADFTYWSAHLYLYNEDSIRQLIESVDLYQIDEIKQIQRYGLSNHLMWLAKGKPGGHSTWNFMNETSLDAEYERKLAEIKACDTLIVICSKKSF